MAAGVALLRATDATLATRYAEHGLRQMRTWFVDPATKMNPALQYARMVPSANPEGIFDAMGLAEVAQAIPFFRLQQADADPIEAWFAAYLDWLTTSRLAGLARDRKDHHASSWLLQTVSCAKLTGNETVLNDCRHRYKSVTIRAQIDEAGMFSHELTSTSAFRDSLTNLDLLAGVCELLSTRFDSVWNYELADGPGMHAAIARFFPYIDHPNKWPYPADLTSFTALPGRRPALLFAARAYARPEYAALWQTLEESSSPDSTAPEIVRSFPIRQPLLWVTPAGESDHGFTRMNADRKAIEIRVIRGCFLSNF